MNGHLTAEKGTPVVFLIVHIGSCCELMISVMHDLEINFNNLTSDVVLNCHVIEAWIRLRDESFSTGNKVQKYDL